MINIINAMVAGKPGVAQSFFRYFYVRPELENF